MSLIGESDGLDHVLVEADEFQLFLRVRNSHVGEIEEEVFLIIEVIGHPVAHGGQQDVADVYGLGRSHPDTNFFAVGCHDWASFRRTRLGLAAREFHAPAEFPMLVLPHFLPALLDDARHELLPNASSNLPKSGRQ